MSSATLSKEVTGTPLPAPSRALSKLANPVYRFFDSVFTSRYNPLYRSGTLAVGFLVILIITGLYLSFFYSVSQPYESLKIIDSQLWFGRWIRSVHRYATVGFVLATLFHILQLLVQGKCWGPRILAWISGVLLLGILMLSAWSGYVMAWDQFGQLVAIAGARTLSIIPALKEILDQSFNGTSALPPGFFFMNLFLHVALPLGMIFFLWVHTSRLSRSVWLPPRAILLGMSLALIVLSILFPVPLLSGADLLKMVGRIPVEISTSFWIPLIELLGTPTFWLLSGIATIALSTVPWWCRPKLEEQRQISYVEPDKCTGCMQCVHDCPYEAIHMTPRNDGRRLVAEILQGNCVSCGICAASCSDHAVGPPGRRPEDQLYRAVEFIKNKETTQGLLIVSCTNNPKMIDMIEGLKVKDPALESYQVECCGCLHNNTITTLLEKFEGLALIGCPARNCFNRDGGDLLAQRIDAKRVPFLDRSIQRDRIWLAAYSEAEASTVLKGINQFRASLSNQHRSKGIRPSLSTKFRLALGVVVLAGILVVLSRYPLGTDPTHAILRLAGTLPSSSAERCRTPSESDVENLPMHMRPKEICDRAVLTYLLSFKLKGHTNQIINIGDQNQRLDKNLFFSIDKQIPPGRHQLEVTLATIENGVKIENKILQQEFETSAGDIKVISEALFR